MSTSRLKGPNTNMEWANLVRTASKAFENAHRNTDSADVKHPKPAITSNNYISTNEIIENNE